MPEFVSVAALAGLLAAAAWSDARRLRIPNAIVISGLAGAFLLAGSAGGWPGVGHALAGAGVGLLCLLPFFVLRMLGAGDVKLMAMVGAFLGPAGAGYATLATMLAGGGVAAFVWWRAHRRNVRMAAASEAVAAVDMKAMRVPYGVAILIGTLGWLAISRL